MYMTMIDLRRGDVVLVAFPFVTRGDVQRKRRPALVVQSDRYNPGRAAIILAAITSTRAYEQLPSKVLVEKESAEGRAAGLRLDSVVDCQTLITLPKNEITHCLGRLPPQAMDRVDRALKDALDLQSFTQNSLEQK
jgi:mRNA interferase MazF